jgi:hypothetical protein
VQEFDRDQGVQLPNGAKKQQSLCDAFSNMQMPFSHSYEDQTELEEVKVL